MYVFFDITYTYQHVSSHGIHVVIHVMKTVSTHVVRVSAHACDRFSFLVERLWVLHMLHVKLRNEVRMRTLLRTYL